MRLPWMMVCGLLATAPGALHAQDDTYDLLILNGHIIDGTGSPWYAGGRRASGTAASPPSAGCKARRPDRRSTPRAWSSRRDSSTCSGSPS